MGIEEKAKAYDEALEKAKVHINNKGIGDTVDLCKHLFPELRGSEDERIRNWLIDYFSSIKKTVWIHRDITCEQILEWLEKQKEPTTEELYAEAGTTEKEYIANTMKMVRAMREKKQEQKPAEIDFEDWDTLGYIRDIVRKHVRRDEEFNALDKWLTEHYVNQKPAWDKYQQELEATDRWQEGYEAGFNAASKPAEWSEEEEKILDKICSHLYVYPEERGKMQKWLKSLRPCHSWKPSEEHLSALLAIFNDPNNIGSQTCQLALTDLYEQLKKL